MCHKSALGSDRAANGFLNAAVSTLVTPPDHITRQNDWTAKKNEECRKCYVQWSIKTKCVFILITIFYRTRVRSLFTPVFFLYLLLPLRGKQEYNWPRLISIKSGTEYID